MGLAPSAVCVDPLAYRRDLFPASGQSNCQLLKLPAGCVKKGNGKKIFGLKFSCHKGILRASYLLGLVIPFYQR